MHFSYLNLWSALGIGVIITAMAMIHDVKAKALLYVLPIPISIGLIATHGLVTASNLLGLLLIWGFLLLVWILTDKYHVNIIVGDIAASLLYIFIGYLITKFVHLSFEVVTILFIASWIVLVWWLRRHLVRDRPLQPSALPPLAKGAAAAVISFGIYSFKDLLKGIVVTFPYNGIFAVIEVRRHLEVFVRSVMRNTVAIAALFVSMYYFQSHVPEAVNFCIGWAAFGSVLWLVQKISV